MMEPGIWLKQEKKWHAELEGQKKLIGSIDQKSQWAGGIAGERERVGKLAVGEWDSWN